MSQFVCITGASLKETQWFSKACNALGGQIGHIPKDAKTAAICQPVRHEDMNNSIVKGLNRVTNPLFALFLAYFCGCLRHYDPVYGGVT